MHPLRLYLKNFLSYGEKGIEIDFSQYQTLLLLGVNGAGKSSILDAILWALWGKTRAGGDTDVMHTGSTDMEVRLDLSIHDHPYRIIRKRSKKGKGFVSVLELQSLTEPITLLTDATISKTQESIHRLLGIDYELLVSSAFLRQGEAQEFTQKTPSKRKDLLASMLNLEQYNLWHEESKKKQRDQEQKLVAVNSQRQYLITEIERLKSDIATLTSQIEAINEPALLTKIQQLNAESKQVEIVLQKQKEQQEKVKFLQQNKTQHLQKSQNIATKLATLTTEQKRLLTILGTTPKAIDVATIHRLDTALEEMQRMKLQQEHIQERKNQLSLELEQLEKAFIEQNNKIQLQITKIEANPLIQQKTAASAEAEIAEIKKIQVDYKNNQERLLNLRETIGGLEHEMELIVQQGKAITQKRSNLAEMEGPCPLCEQALSPEHQKAVMNKYDEERNSLLAQHAQVKIRKDSIQKESDTLKGANLELQKKIDQLSHLQEALALWKQITDWQDRQNELVETYKSDKARIEQQIIITVESLKNQAFSEEAWSKLKEEKAFLQAQDQRYRDHQQSIQQLQSIEKEIQFLTETVSENNKAIEELELELKNLQSAILMGGVSEQKLTTLRTDWDEAIAQQQNLNQQKNLLLHMQEESARIQKTAESQTAEVATLEETARTYSLLAEAFGNRGIPTMIIEEAIPRLEQYANDILSFLSDNTMSIRFSLTRASKVDRDNQIDTLDILIGDTFGTRAYELFSGGEAFRIDVALRLALTKLLTERSNGSVDFLVIDEGFGSQDENGRDHIVQIIHKLEKYFKLIIIITHVDQLKETFTDRLLIRKGPQGSEVMVDVED